MGPLPEEAKPAISYVSGETLMAHGPHALHDHVASHLETALGRSLPQMEVRFHNLSLSADVVVTRDHSAKGELPTLLNVAKKQIGKLSINKNIARKEILKNVSGSFKPGTVTLLLGQPGSGKSAFMQLLSGRFPETNNVHVGGEISYNGEARQSLKKVLPQFVAYVTQRDKHYPTLTVRETLEFAHAMSGGKLSKRAEELLGNGTPEENKAALDAARALYEHYPDVIIRQLGLMNCQNTIVGNALLRGVSGGERKRVTTGEMEFGRRYVTLMDEISTGLDSAATYDIISTQRSIAKTFRKTIVIALLQPSPEVFALFDEVLILNQGEVMYHGPRELVEDYFETLGFVCPPERDIADYLLDLGTKQQSVYQVRDWKQFPRSPSDFAEAFRQSRIYQQTLQQLGAPLPSQLLLNVEAHMNPMPQFHESFWAGTGTLIKRQALVTIRNTAFLKGRGIMVVIIGLLYGSTFYKVNPLSAQVVLGTLFQTILFVSLGQASQIPVFIAAREIFYKQRASNFLRTSSYVMSNSVSQIPLATLESVVFGSMVYWMCDLVSTASAFISFIVLLILTNLAFASWFFFLAAIAPDMHISKPLAMISVSTFILFAGFAISKGEIPSGTIWIYWLNPIAWCFRALSVNEFQSPRYMVCIYRGVNYCEAYGLKFGEYALSLFDVPTGRHWIWLGMVFLAFVYVLFMFFAWATLEYHRYESPEHVSLDNHHEDDEMQEHYALAQTPTSSDGVPRFHDNVTVQVNDSPNEKHFTPVTIAFQDLWYSVPNPSNPEESMDLLKGITGYALPGSMTALMGSSGAGKTTLMDVIAGRKTGGQIRGKILLNGYEANDLAIRRCTGYCEQMDIHSEASTIREALTFSAFLRQDNSVPDSKKYDSVIECLDLLDMHDIADQIIRGSSVEQMKRLTIGVELAAQPSVIFLDEPTSGLDARSAKLIMDGVRKVANSGRTIVCTIHQPSSEVFYLFDRLLLLKRGGQTVYFGDLGKNSRTLIEYFESFPSVTHIEPGYNPATWMLECIGAGVSSSSNAVDYVELFNQSKMKQILDDAMAQEGLSFPSSTTREMLFSKKRAASNWTQMRFLVQRFFDMYWRTPSYNMTRFVVTLFLALLHGVLYGSVDYTTYQGMNSGIGMVFMSMVFNGLVSFNSVLPIASDDRAAFYRERASQTYNALWYFVGSTLVEIPYCFAASLLFTVIYYPMVGLTGFGTAVLYWIFLSLNVLLNTYMGQFLVYAMPSIEVAAIIGVLMNSIFFLFMGFNPPASSIPEGYRWLYHIAPQKFPLTALIALVFSDCPNEPTYDAVTGTWSNVSSDLSCQPVEGIPSALGKMTIKEYVKSVFEIEHSQIWSSFGYLILAIVVFRVLALLSLRFINHQKK